MAERFPLVVNPNTRKIEEIKETDSLELTGNGISISGSTGTVEQYLKSNGSGELEWADPLIDFATRPLANFGGDVNITGQLDVGGDVQLGVDSFDQVTTSGKLGVAAAPSTLTATFSVGVIENALLDKGAAAFKTRPITGGGASAIYIEEQTGDEGWYLRVNSGGDLVFNDSGSTDRFNLGDGGGATLIGTLQADGIDLGDNESVLLGTGDDFSISFDATDAILSSGENPLRINATEFYVKNAADSLIGIEYTESNGVKLNDTAGGTRLETTTAGANVTGVLRASSSLGVNVPIGESLIDTVDVRGTVTILTDVSPTLTLDADDDSAAAIMFKGAPTGAGSENTQMGSVGFGGDATNLELESATKVFVSGTAVELNHGGSKKLETTSTGATVTGTIAADGATIDGSIDVGTNQSLQFKTNATDLIFNNPFTTGSPTSNVNLYVRRGDLSPTGLRWDETINRWQFSNDGVQYYNMLLPEETVSAAADEFGASADPNRYDIASTTIVNVESNNYLQVTLANIADIQKFTLSHQVKMFGASPTLAGDLVDPPIVGTTTYSASVENTVFNDPEIDHSFYVYAVAAYDLENGDISTSIVGSAVIENIVSDRMNEANYNALTIQRVADTGIALYRGEFTTNALASDAIANFSTSTSLFKLIQVLGPKEFPSDSLTAQYTDYGNYDVPLWIDTAERNPDGTYIDPVHFPLNPPTVAKRGWVIGSVRDINGANGTFRINVPSVTASDPADYDLYLYHDDTLNIQDAIDTTAAAGRNYLIIPGGTYLIDHLKLPSGFTLGGLNDATVFKKQYWTTTNINNTNLQGLKNGMFFSDTFDFTQPAETWTLRDFTMRDLVVDGNGAYQILYDVSSLGTETNNCILGFPNSDFIRIISVKVRNTYGPALFAEGSINMQINGTTFLNGMQTERYGTPCILMSDCENTTIGTSFFRNFPGALDFTTGQILAISGSVIRNCGAGIQIYGSVNTDVLDNIILGPVDEFIPIPDLYDTDYDGVNISVFPGTETQTPVYQYQSEGNNVDLSDAIINFNVYNATVAAGVETVDLLNPRNDITFQYFNPVDAELVPQDDITVGQIRFKLSAAQSINVPAAAVNTYLVYGILGIDYDDIGSDVEFVLDTGTVEGTGLNRTYLLTVTNQAAFDAVVVDDYIKLASHDYAPDVGVNVWRILDKQVTTENKLELEPYQEDANGNLTLLTGLTTVDGGTPALGGGYIQVRQQFVIAKGVLSRVQ